MTQNSNAPRAEGTWLRLKPTSRIIRFLLSTLEALAEPNVLGNETEISLNREWLYVRVSDASTCSASDPHNNDLIANYQTRFAQIPDAVRFPPLDVEIAPPDAHPEVGDVEKLGTFINRMKTPPTWATLFTEQQNIAFAHDAANSFNDKCRPNLAAPPPDYVTEFVTGMYVLAPLISRFSAPRPSVVFETFFPAAEAMVSAAEEYTGEQAILAATSPTSPTSIAPNDTCAEALRKLKVSLRYGLCGFLKAGYPLARFDSPVLGPIVTVERWMRKKGKLVACASAPAVDQ